MSGPSSRYQGPPGSTFVPWVPNAPKFPKKRTVKSNPGEILSRVSPGTSTRGFNGTHGSSHNRVSEASAPALYPSKGLCKDEAKASHIVKEQQFANLKENHTADLVKTKDYRNSCSLGEDTNPTCQLPNAGYCQQTTQDDATRTDTPSPFADEVFDLTSDTNDDNIILMRTSTGVRAPPYSRADTPISVAETSGYESPANQPNNALEDWRNPAAFQTTNSPNSTQCISDTQPEFDAKSQASDTEPQSTNSSNLLSKARDGIVFESANPSDEDTKGRKRASGAGSKDQDSLYNVEKIVEHYILNNSMYYLVEWEGYSAEHNTVEPEENLKGCPMIIRQYWWNHNSEDSVSESGNSLGPFSDRKQNVNTSQSTSIHKRLDRIEKILSILTQTQRHQAESKVPQRTASTGTARKRKRSPVDQGYTSKDEDDEYDHVGFAKKKEGRQRKHCGRCRKVGHDTRTCRRM